MYYVNTLYFFASNYSIKTTSMIKHSRLYSLTRYILNDINQCYCSILSQFNILNYKMVCEEVTEIKDSSAGCKVCNDEDKNYQLYYLCGDKPEEDRVRVKDK